MRSLVRKTLAVAWAGVLGFVILVFGAGVWSALVSINLNVSPGIPWAVPAMSVVLVLMCVYLAGKGWPRGTAQARSLCLRARLVPAPIFGWSVLAGTLSVMGFAGFWIVMTQLVRMQGNALPDFSRYPWFTVLAIIVMGSVSAPLTEEPAFRGYCQVILEREFSGPVAVAISSVVFALAHGPTQGFLWPKLLFYFLVGIVFGTTAYLTRSILPAIPGHIFGLLVFFTVVWPQDAKRGLVWETGADFWFWVHVAQTVVFAALTILALRRLAQATLRISAAKT